MVQDNDVDNADIAVSVGSWGWFNSSADNTKVKDNVASDVEHGVLMESVAEPYGGALTQMDPSVSNTKVQKNDLTGGDGTDDNDSTGRIGIGILVEDNVDNEYDPVARNNKVRNNAISDFDDEFEDEGSQTKIGPAEP